MESRPIVENARLTGKISKYTYPAPLLPPQCWYYKQTSSCSAPPTKTCGFWRLTELHWLGCFPNPTACASWDDLELMIWCCVFVGGKKYFAKVVRTGNKSHTIRSSVHHGGASGYGVLVTHRSPASTAVIIDSRAQLCFGSFMKCRPENGGARAHHWRVPGSHWFACFHVLIFSPFYYFYVLWYNFQHSSG